VFCLPDGTRTFAFIHGDWALDNSRGGRHCGVNDEIRILAEEGCYADFTFPSLGDAQPSKINSIYYVTDDPDRPKSYNTGEDVVVGGRQSGDLMMVQGPLVLRTKRRYGIPFFPAIEAAELEGASAPAADRVRAWISANVHVKGRPEWLFVKLHTHGAMSGNFDHNLGDTADAFFTELERTYCNPREGSSTTSPPGRCTTSSRPPRRGSGKSGNYATIASPGTAIWREGPAEWLPTSSPSSFRRTTAVRLCSARWNPSPGSATAISRLSWWTTAAPILSRRSCRASPGCA